MRSPLNLKICLGLLFLSALVSIAVAQQTGTPGGSTGSTGGAPRRDIPVRPTTPQPQTAPQSQQQQPSTPMMFFSGNVVLEDGSAPPYGAAIELNCGGAVTREAMVSINGRFSFQVGGDNRFGQVFADASQGIDEGDSRFSSSSGSGYGAIQSQRIRRLVGCEIRAQFGGYNSTSLRITEEPSSGLNELGTIVIYPVDRVQGSMVSLTNLMAPKSAKKAVEQAKKAAQKKKLPEAEELFKSAIQSYPKYAEAWFDLGLIYENQGRVDDAVASYHEAIKADEMYVKPYVRLAESAYDRQNWREAADLTEKLISLDPVTLVEAYFISALAHFHLGELDLSEARARRGQRMDFANRFPQFYLILANISALRQDSAGSAQELRGYLKSAPNASNAALVRSRLQKLEEQARTAGP